MEKNTWAEIHPPQLIHLPPPALTPPLNLINFLLCTTRSCISNIVKWLPLVEDDAADGGATITTTTTTTSIRIFIICQNHTTTHRFFTHFIRFVFFEILFFLENHKSKLTFSPTIATTTTVVVAVKRWRRPPFSAHVGISCPDAKSCQYTRHCGGRRQEGSGRRSWALFTLLYFLKYKNRLQLDASSAPPVVCLPAWLLLACLPSSCSTATLSVKN